MLLAFSFPKLACQDLCSILQVHFPFPTFPQQVLADALTEALESKRVKAVGVCNYNARQLEELHGILDRRGIPLASNQVRTGFRV